MLQYMAALNIRAQVPDLKIGGYDMPIWGLSDPEPEALAPLVLELTGRYLPVKAIVRNMSQGRIDALCIKVVSLRLANLISVAEARSIFHPPSDLQVPTFGPEHIVVNIRGGEILGDVHPDYGPIPLSIIEQVIASSGLSPVFMGQLGDDRYSAAIRRRFPEAHFLVSQNPLIDFETLRRASEIVVAASTFSWLAAWMSDATRIHLPVTGFLNPQQRPDIDMLPVNDTRYRFYECDVRRWGASDADFEALVTPRTHALLDNDEIRSRLARAARRTRKADAAQELLFAWRCRRAGGFRA